MDTKEQIRLTMEGAARPDVLARRRARMALDPLAHRARSAALWMSDTSWPRFGTATWAIYRQPGFRRFLMPGVRAYMAAREAERHARWETNMAESERRWKYAMALKKAKPLPLFEESADPNLSGGCGMECK